jgi:glycine oxidase
VPDDSISDVIVVGAGVIGLATALELADRGLSVRVLERGKPGGESSWAGAGIIYPAFPENAANAFERLRGESYVAWPGFVERLRQDVGFLRCGSVVLERTASELKRVVDDHRRAGAKAERCEVRELEPNIVADRFHTCFLPEVCQVRNPWLIRALVGRLRELNVPIQHGVAAKRVLEAHGRAVGVETETGERLYSKRILLSAGAWTPSLLVEPALDIVPIRGQILLFRPRTRILSRIVESGKHYLVPRGDGRILAGSTEEHAGFEKKVTPEAFDELYSFATTILPELASVEIEASWSGLRPGTPTGTPYLFEDERRRGLWIAAGHFRLGLQLAPGTAKLLADWMTRAATFASPKDFSPTSDRQRYVRSFTV